MGDETVQGGELHGESLRAFMRRLLDDLRTLERILEGGMIEEGVRRIGAEQELFLVDDHWRPAGLATAILADLDDPHFTTELGRFNLEINLDPCLFGGDCLARLEAQLVERLDAVRRVAARHGCEPVLAGILPTIRKSDLGLDNMTPKARYHALNRAMTRMRGGAYEFHIKGLDELIVKHDSVMLEACNASFQVHFQVGAHEFPNLYNVAQVVAAPVLAVSCNSPMLFGRQLWMETRIALFQQAVDTRSFGHWMRERAPRVSFGRRWVRRSVLELFQEDVARFRALVGGEFDGRDSSERLDDGDVPALRALCLHNGTVYRWNRACYGITDGRPHLRIENRVLPAGPSVLDEVANAALWFGLIRDLSHRFPDVTEVFEFEDARFNFRAAARLGMQAQLNWLDGEVRPATELMERELLPAARRGLADAGIRHEDIARYLDVIEERVRRRQCGSRWLTRSYSRMRGTGSPGERVNALTAALSARQRDASPVATWPYARLDEGGGWKSNFMKVEQFMTTDLYTVHEDEPLDLVASLMDWERIRHVLVEDQEGRLVGLVSYRALLRLFARGELPGPGGQRAVSEFMIRDPVAVAPETPTLEAIQTMRRHGVGCLPVVKDDRLVGIVTERDLMNLASELLEDKLRD